LPLSLGVWKLARGGFDEGFCGRGIDEVLFSLYVVLRK